MKHTSIRKHRINWILNFVSLANKSARIVKEEILVSEACLEFGAGRRYIKEILTDLLNTKRLVIEYGEVWNPVAYDEQKIIEKEDYHGTTPTITT